ncbi:MAG: hypothetical protein ACW9WZ_02530 [Nitrosopumilus sp.]
MKQTLTSENSGNTLESSCRPDRKSSVVISFSDDAAKSPEKSDVRFVFNHAEPVSVRMYIDESGEVHSSFRKIAKTLPRVKTESTEEIESTIEPIDESDVLPVKETIQEPPVEKIKSRRGRPRGSKNKTKKFTPDMKKFKQEWFETNAEFKARVAEEMKNMTSQTA